MIKLIFIFCLFLLLNVFMVNTEKSTKKIILDFHNKLRDDILKGVLPNQPQAKVMPKLKWNKTLARKAKSHVKKCILDVGDLSELYIGKVDSVGQNIAEHTSIENILDTWLQEGNDYNFESNTCSTECGNYKQMVSANTTEIGCASNKCGKKYMIVCNYAPGADEERPYEKVSGNTESQQKKSSK
ncbi:GLIPR1-like protein [Schistosoma japonicum]|uniref:GLIPR1-like protein n=1 Tax=Schistosoma japonicum TaxID=6182 RepID=A0A4Z2CRX3_SCHJA|nr:GLIPR1-like protein 1 [Schistosoma japonicum]TNN06963.1 GLIPR1-like protein [Schistosoma japonicum]